MFCFYNLQYFHINTDLSEEDIEKHIEWHNKYLELKIKRKNAIDKWKNSKN